MTASLPELLAPAGGPAAFSAAVAAGADAVYVGLSAFNARRGAENFTPETFAAATRAAHLAGVRVYVTMNILIKDAEMPAALAQARQAWALGADALIVQDWGLLAELHRRWPEIELHLSTQAAVMDARGVAFARERGAARVTLARELSVGEIAECAATGVDVEVFGHGALCFCYSGLCLMSSLRGARSANRGLCAQPCRLPYVLEDATGARVAAPGRDRPLCPRDCRTIDDLPALVAAGVASLKVEGRMKAPEYVHSVVRAYRSALDELASGSLAEEGGEAAGMLGPEGRNELLARAFNRDFTNAYLHGTSGDELMSYERSNNRGELVGSVCGGRRLPDRRVLRGGDNGGRERLRTLRRAEVQIRLDRHVGEGDLLELRPVRDASQFLTALARADAAASEVIVVEAARTVPEGSEVRVIRSQAAIDAARVVRADAPRARAVDVRVTARMGEPLAVTLATVDGAASVTVAGMPVEPARTRAVTADELAAHAARLGGTPFSPASASAEVDAGVGLPFSAVHRLRAQAVDALGEALLAPYATRVATALPTAEDVAADLRFLRLHDGVRERGGATVELCALVPDAARARAAVVAGATRVYADADSFAEVAAAVGTSVTVVPWLDELCRASDRARLDALVAPGAPVAVGNVSELAHAARAGALAEARATIPAHNASALVALEQAGVAGVWLSGELSLAELRALVPEARVPVGLVVFGRERAMTSEHCVLMATGACVGDCARCALRRRDHALLNIDDDLYPVTSDLRGRSRVWAPRPLDVTPELDELVACGVRRLMVDATLLDAVATGAAVRRVVDALAAVRRGATPAPRAAGATPGHMHAPVD